MPRHALLLSLVLMVAIATFAGAGPPPDALGASVRAHHPAVEQMLYPATDPAGENLPDEPWRVIHGTGNCCENYLAATEAGRLLDFGGSLLRFSDDQGSSWSEVVGLGQLGSGEGAVVEAPNGDIVGVTWDPYSGDRLEGFKLDTSDGNWYFVQQKLHSPFLDRPYLATVKGPFSVAGESIPYLTYLAGGWPSRTTYSSTDGLHYTPTTSSTQPVGGSKSKYLTMSVDPKADAMQPLTVFGVAPLTGGGALAWSGGGGPLSLSILEPPSTVWSPFTFPGQPSLHGRLLADSAGRLHNVVVSNTTFTYKVSSDGGKGWAGTTVPLPVGYEAVMPTFDRFWDFKTNSKLDIAAVSMYARNTNTGTDQNLVFVLSTKEDKPKLTKVLFTGEGDKSFGTGLGASDRLDFITLAILPDGRVSTTFLDGRYPSPALAVTSESQAPQDGPGPEPSPSTSIEPSPSVSPAPSTSPPPEVDRTPPAITSVKDAPDPFSPDGDGKRDRATIRFRLSEGAEVSVSIFTRRGKLVRRIKSGVWMTRGDHRVRWSGLNRFGRRVGPGRYVYRIAAVDRADNAAPVARGAIIIRY